MLKSEKNFKKKANPKQEQLNVDQSIETIESRKKMVSLMVDSWFWSMMTDCDARRCDGKKNVNGTNNVMESNTKQRSNDSLSICSFEKIPFEFFSDF